MRVSLFTVDESAEGVLQGYFTAYKGTVVFYPNGHHEPISDQQFREQFGVEYTARVSGEGRVKLNMFNPRKYLSHLDQRYDTELSWIVVELDDEFEDRKFLRDSNGEIMIDASGEPMPLDNFENESSGRYWDLIRHEPSWMSLKRHLDGGHFLPDHIRCEHDFRQINGKWIPGVVARAFGLQEEISCPDCGSGKVVRIIYGMPTDDDPDADSSDWRNKKVLGGCQIWDDNPIWACTECDCRF